MHAAGRKSARVRKRKQSSEQQARERKASRLKAARLEREERGATKTRHTETRQDADRAEVHGKVEALHTTIAPRKRPQRSATKRRAGSRAADPQQQRLSRREKGEGKAMTGRAPLPARTPLPNKPPPLPEKPDPKKRHKKRKGKRKNEWKKGTHFSGTAASFQQFHAGLWGVSILKSSKTTKGEEKGKEKGGRTPVVSQRERLAVDDGFFVPDEQ
ncbi:hypothetical protein B0H13DRAFT_1891841 [Mycena leptocephala]|nr:hypothetical protein B0H13DRAFT_1891841 [Mycena leptocephala]